MKYVLCYEVADDVMTKIREHNPEHRARWARCHARGELLMIGPFTDLRDGAMAVFTTREAAEEFATGDPFVRHGVVRKWRILEWMEALVPDAPGASLSGWRPWSPTPPAHQARRAQPTPQASRAKQRTMAG